jgi:glycosyltransferase involved in cell wall biosynthesis
MADELDITVLVTCFNERSSVVPTIEEISRAVKRAGLSSEIIVTDDASQDDSADIIARYQHEHPDANVRLVRHPANRGLVFGVFEAARLGQGRYFWAVAGDNNVPEETALALLRHVGKADIIVPLVERVTGRSTFRNLLSRLYAGLVRALSGCRIRYFNGSSIYRRLDLVSVEAGISGFAYAADSILKLLDRGRSYVEVAVVYRERTHGRSTAVSWSHLRAVSAFMLKLLWRRIKLLSLGPAMSRRSAKAECPSD